MWPPSLDSRLHPDPNKTPPDPGLPLILAGPILRQAQPTSVTVWLALQKSATVTLSIALPESPLQSLLSASVPTTQIGPNLHLIAITATQLAGQPSLAYGTIYIYTLKFDSVAGESGSLDLFHALVPHGGATEPSKFVYSGFTNPSFLLPPTDISKVRIAQGSCRKLHWLDKDGLALLDDMLSAAPGSLTERPQILMLGGDQIYADEVADILLALLTEASDLLLGPEVLPDGKHLTDYPPAYRSDVIKDHGFTSDDTRSHLMGFGEYVAMYLFAWSDVLWPVTVPNAYDFGAWVSPRIPSGKPKLGYMDVSSSTADQAKGLANTRDTLWKVRRALANIPTYMILDDHEITDDFNMVLDFCERVYDDAIGRRVIQNGLLAYALCQHWGNAPDQFSGSGAGATLLSYFSSSGAGYPSFVTDTTKAPTLMRIVGIHPVIDVLTRGGVYHENTGSLTYNYTIEGAAFQVIVTDTRTWRTYPARKPLSSISPVTPADLLDDTQVNKQITNILPALGNRLQLVVITTNFPPAPAIRQALRDVPRTVPYVARHYQFEDFWDSWDIDQQDYARTVRGLSQRAATSTSGVFSRCIVVLSGDVHTSQVNCLEYYEGEVLQCMIVQLIASALLNGADSTVAQHTGGYWWTKSVAKPLQEPVMLDEAFVGWFPTLANGTLLGQLYLRVGTDRLTYPWYFERDRPTRTARTEVQLPIAWNAGIAAFATRPDYHYRLRYLAATEVGTLPASSILLPTPSPDPFDNIAAASKAMSMMYAVPGREMVGISNIADISFVVSDNQLAVNFRARYQAKSGLHYSLFSVPFANSGIVHHPAEPPL